MKKKLTVLISTLVIGGSVLLILPSIHAQQASTNVPPKAANTGMEPVPMMHAVLKDLRQARARLEIVKHEFGGHRAAAIKACDEAIKEVNEGIKYTEEKH